MFPEEMQSTTRQDLNISECIKSSAIVVSALQKIDGQIMKYY